MKAGTPTGYQDNAGTLIKVGDRIKHPDGTILTIDKFGRAVSSFGIATALEKLGAVNRGRSDNGDYYARLIGWTITDAPAPPKPEGPTVKPGDDSQNMAPDRVRDPRNEKLLKKNWKKMQPADPEVVVKLMESEAVEKGLTPDEARLVLALHDAQDQDLADVLRDRGYTGILTKTTTLKI